MLDALRSLDSRTDAVLGQFETDITRMVNDARIRVAIRLRGDLAFGKRGEILATPANMRRIQALPRVFQQVLERQGYDEVLGQFVASFDGGLPLFEDVLAKLSDSYKVRPVSFSAADRAYLQTMKQGTVLSIDDVIDRAARTARSRAMFMVGGSPFEDVAIELSERLGVSVGQANSLAATGISTFYRTAAAKGYEKIENQLSDEGRSLEYTYYGPPATDVLIRPFCQRLMKQAANGRTWTRAEIDAMDNQQLADVFTTGGGWNCRHQWIVALED